jgi:hypothetical protein
LRLALVLHLEIGKKPISMKL